MRCIDLIHSLLCYLCLTGGRELWQIIYHMQIFSLEIKIARSCDHYCFLWKVSIILSTPVTIFFGKGRKIYPHILFTNIFFSSSIYRFELRIFIYTRFGKDWIFLRFLAIFCFQTSWFLTSENKKESVHWQW